MQPIIKSLCMKKHDPIQAMECIKTLNRLNILPTAEELMLLLIAIHRYNTQGLRLHLPSSVDTAIDNATTTSTDNRANGDSSGGEIEASIYQRDQKALIRDADQLIEFLSYHLLGFKYTEAVQVVSYINHSSASSFSFSPVGDRESKVEGEEEEVEEEEGILVESEAALHGLVLDRNINRSTGTKATSFKLNDDDGSTTNSLIPTMPSSSSSTSISIINNSNISSGDTSCTNGTYTTILATNTTFLDLITNSDFTSAEASLIAVNGKMTYFIP